MTKKLTGTTAIVTGASRGFGEAIANALCAAGADVVGVARSVADLAQVAHTLGEAFTPVPADVADPASARRLIGEHAPRLLVLCAGAAPVMAPLPEQTWERFSDNWNVDVAQAFHWIGTALREPLAPGSTVVSLSSGAALNGSPLSGGYAGAKAMVRFVTDYARLEADRAALDIRFVSVLPQLTPHTDLGARAVAAYAERQGVSVERFAAALHPALTPQQVGAAVLDIATGERRDGHAYSLTSAGLTPLG